MKRQLFGATLGTAAIAWAASMSAQQIPGRGFTALLCVAERLGGGPQAGQVTVAIANDTGSSAQVTITHGVTSSTHLLVYQDANETGRLDCGDVIISVT